MSIRRGKATDLVFERGIAATSYFYSTDPDTGRAVETVEPISVAKARTLFDASRRAKMKRRDEHTFLFIIGTSIGYERIEVEIA